METINFYAVKFRDGKWLRSKGYNGYGESRVDSLDKAKIWTKIGPAKAQITWWAANTEFTKDKAPVLVVLTASITQEIDCAAEGVKRKLKRDIASKKSSLKYFIKVKYDNLKKYQDELEKLEKDLVAISG